MKKRNYTLDVIKFLFAIVIALGHLGCVIGNSGLIVNLFFIISGYFLVKSCLSSKYENAWDYTINRLKRVYPYYLFAFLVMIISMCIQNDQNILDCIKMIMRSLPELTLMQNVGIYGGGINYPLWFLCDCIIASHVMFSLVTWNKNVTLNAVCPLTFICGVTFFVNNEVNIWGIEGGFVYLPLLRAFAYLALGMTIYKPVNKMLDWLSKFNRKKVNVGMTIYGVVAVGVCYINRHDAYVSLLAFIFLMLFCLYPSGFVYSMLNHKLFKYCEKLSLAIFLNHAVIVSWFNYYGIECNGKVASFFVAVLIVYCIIMIKIVDLIMHTLKEFGI